MTKWNWTPRARAIGATIKAIALVLGAWVSVWLLVTGHLPPNPFILP